MNMVSMSYIPNSISSMYQKNHANNLQYAPPHHWYPAPPPSSYQLPPAASSMHHSAGNGQYLTGLDGEMAAYYNQHHPMYSQGSPDWNLHDNFGQPLIPSSLIPSAMTNGAHLNVNQTTSTGNSDQLNNHIGNDELPHDTPPSPPNTVGSGCSEMSSPTMQNGSGGTVLHDNTSPHNTSIGRPLSSKSPFEWIKKPSYTSQPLPGRTRTKDKYRVVYTDYQRLELEKEFHTSRYITIRRKSELAQSLHLSERQVKIWFQNRRAKDRKQTKKRGGRHESFEEAMSFSHNPMSHLHGSGLDIKPKLEGGFMATHQYGGHLHNIHHHHLSHSMHSMSSMASMGSMGPMSTMGSMGLHNPLAGLHLHHSPAGSIPASPLPANTSAAATTASGNTIAAMNTQQQVPNLNA